MLFPHERQLRGEKKAHRHYSINGRRPQLDSCWQAEPTLGHTTDPAKVTCPRCKSQLLGQGSDEARRRKIREGHCTPEEMSRAIAQLRNARERASVRLAYYLGLRATEVGLIHLRQINWTQGLIDFVRMKGSNGVPRPLAPVEADLHAWVTVRATWLKKLKGGKFKDTPWLFPAAYDPRRPMNRFSFLLIWRRAAKAAGLPKKVWNVHSIKHSCAMNLLASGASLRAVQQWLGHQSVTSTEVYAQVSKPEVDVATKMMGKLMEEK